MIFSEKTIKKIIIAIVFVFMFNFTFSYLGTNVVFASGEGSDGTVNVGLDKEMEEGGGKLLLPIHSLILFIADSVMGLLQNSFLTSEPIVLEAKSDSNRSANGIGFVIGGVVVTAVAILTWISPVPGDEFAGTGIAAAWWASGVGLKVVSTVALTTSIVGPGMIIYGGSAAYENLQGEFKLPNIWFTPAEIFAGEVPLFDINFLNPSEDKIENKIVISKSLKTLSGSMVIYDGQMPLINENTINREGTGKYYNAETNEYDMDTIYSDYVTYASDISNDLSGWYSALNEIERTPQVVAVLSQYGDGTGFTTHISTFLNDNLQPTYNAGVKDISRYNEMIETCNFGSAQVLEKLGEIEIYQLSDDDKEKLAEKVSSLSIEYETVKEEKIVATYESAAGVLQPAVSSIYKAFRVVAIVALLTILVYVGIRMVLSSVSKDKAKYKQLLIDWFVAFVMLFTLHYIMSFILSIGQELTGICNTKDIDICRIAIPGDTEILDSDTGMYKYIWESEASEGYGKFPTSFVGAIRFNAGLVQKIGFTASSIAYTLMYLVLIIYIIIFSFQYMRRVLYMAFLTMIAPLIAITYPLDKIHDGKAQGFNMWLREYIFNALLQPIHYIIYVIIMGSAMQLVLNHPVYGLVALGFMVPAENLIRKLFGFEKASTVGNFGGIAGAGAVMLMNGIRQLMHKPTKSKGRNQDNGATGKNESDTKIRKIDTVPSGEEGTTPLGARGMQNTGNGHASGVGGGAMNPQGTNGTQNGTSSNNPKRRMINGAIDGAKALGGHYTRRMINGAKNVKPLRALRRGLTYGIGAATLGSIGLAAGIASGDPSKALQYTMTGGMVGGNLGRNLGETASNIIGVDGASKAFMTGMTGEQYSEIERSQNNRDFKMNVSNYDNAIRKVTPEGWADMSKDGGIIDEALEYGINDIGTMCNIYKVKQKLGNGTNAQRDAFRAYQLSKQFGDFRSNKKTEENLMYLLRTKGALAREDEIKNLIDTYNNI